MNNHELTGQCWNGGEFFHYGKGWHFGIRMIPRGARTVVLLVMVGIVCFTSIRLVNVTMELENVRRTGFRAVIEAEDIRYIGQVNHETAMETNLTQNTRAKYLNHIIDCKALFEGNSGAITYVKSILKETPYTPPMDFELYTQARDCSIFRNTGYMDHIVSEEERSFPIAFSILLYKDVSQVNLLLRAIYRPQNLYCIHVDANSKDSVFRAMAAITDCFENVFLVSKREKIVYAGFSRLQADLNCMKDLLAAKREWKYFINLPGQEFPLKTNAEIVKILKIYNGANDIEGITGARMLHARYKNKHVYITKNGEEKIISTQERNPPPPHNVTVVKGSAYGVFSRAFVDFILNDQRAKDVLEWSRAVLSPDEYYWATLHHSQVLKPPGGYKGPPDKKPWLATYASWHPEPCTGKRMRGVCVFTSGDLSFLASKHEMFANKFILSRDPVALMCLEQWLHNKSVSSLPFDAYYYQKLPFIIE